MEWQKTSAFKKNHTHRALERKVRIMERWSPDPLDGSKTCLYVSVHVQTVDSLNYIFDVKLHQYLITCNTLTRKEPKGFTTKALVVFLHDWSCDTYPSSGDTSTWYKWYMCLNLFFSPSQALLAIRRLDRLIWAFQEENLKVVWLTLVREHLATCTAPRLLRMDLHSAQLSQHTAASRLGLRILHTQMTDSTCELSSCVEVSDYNRHARFG